MEREKIVSLFLGSGMSIDPRGLEFFHENPQQLDIFFEKIKKLEEKPMTIDLEFIKKILDVSPTNIEEVKKVATEGRLLTVDDVSRIFAERYARIQKYFSNRIDLVNPISINKITGKTMRFSLVVMIKEKDERNLTLGVEDLTGETTIQVNSTIFNQVVCDSVIGILCEQTNNKIEGMNILWPDIPLKREIPKSNEDICCMFLSDLHLEENFEEKTEKILKEINALNCKKLYLFLFGKNFSHRDVLENFVVEFPQNVQLILIHGSEKFDSEKVLCFSSPAFLNIDKKINLLLCDGTRFSDYGNIRNGKKPEEIMLNLLKMRHLDPIFKIENLLEEERLTIDIVPDIFVSGSFGPAGNMNYKGTTILSCGNFPSEPVYWIVGLSSRQSIKVNFS